MFSLGASKAPSPSLTYGQVLKGIERKEISKIKLVQGNPVSLYEKKDGEVGTATISATDYFIEKADTNDVDLIIDIPEKPLFGPGDVFSIVLIGTLLYSVLGQGRMNPMNQITNTFDFEMK